MSIVTKLKDWIARMARRLRFWGQGGSGGPPAVPTLPTLGVLSLSQTAFPSGSSASGTILGATPGSTIVGTNLPAGFTINSAARTWSRSSTPGSNGILTLTETLAGYSPRSTNIPYAITTGAPASPGKLDFSAPGQAALLVLMEDI